MSLKTKEPYIKCKIAMQTTKWLTQGNIEYTTDPKLEIQFDTGSSSGLKHPYPKEEGL